MGGQARATNWRGYTTACCHVNAVHVKAMTTQQIMVSRAVFEVFNASHLTLVSKNQ